MADIVTKQELEAAKIDVKNAGEAVNEKKIVNPRYGAPFKSLPLAIEELNIKADDVIAKGFYTGYTTETALKASLPAVSEMRARADDTRKIWRWNRISAEGVTPVTGIWTDTGPSDVDKAIEEFIAEAQRQGVALDQLEEYYSYLMQQLAQVAIDRGWAASFIVSADGSTQQEINDFGGAKWRNKPLGYDIGSTVKLDSGDTVKSTVANNIINPNVDMTGWVFDSGFESLRNFKPDPTGTASSQLSILKYLDTLPFNPAPIHTPKGYANGGVLNIPRGRYVITEPIKLKRGVRICGESSESTQIISRSLTGVFIYEDDGGYVPDEIVAENISIWQDSDYVPTSGAAFEFKEGEYTSAVMFVLRNVLIEGTYKGVEAISGIGCSLDNSRITKCVNHGVDINNKGDSSKSTTATTLKNTYIFQNGANGLNIKGGSYISVIGGGIDSNVGYGCAADTTNTFFFNSGAERNGLGNIYLKDLSSGIVQTHSIQHDGAGHGLVLNNASGLTLIGSSVQRSGINTGTAIFFEGAPKVVNVIGLTNAGYTRETLTNNLAYINFNILSGSLSGGVQKGGSTNNWQFGNTLGLDLTSQVSVVGLTEATTKYGFKSSPSFTSVDATYNSASFMQFISSSAASPTNYNLSIGQYIENAFLGSNTTATRTAGQYIKEQTRGSTANANLMIDGGQGTVPTGNWSIYSGSTRTSYFGGAIQSAAGIGIFGVTPPTFKRSISGKKTPTTIAEQNAVIDTVVAALVAYGFVSDDRN